MNSSPSASPSASPTPSLPNVSVQPHTEFPPDEPILSVSHPFTSSLTSTRIVQSHSPHWNTLHRYPDNHITNTKYTVWSFLPLSLYNQCRLAMNKYFLLIALLQLWPYITPVNPVTTWVPLAVIFLISTVKEGVDDYRRMRQDRLANERRVTIMTSVGAVECKSEEVQCGDIVKVMEGEEFCADMVLMASSEKSGGCWIETSNVDGETNLKGRVALPETQRLTEADSGEEDGLGRLKCTVECAVPNKNIYGFDSTITLSNSTTLPLSTEQLLLQATTLCNTAFIYGLVVYTGNETKVAQNKNVPRHKQTTLDAQIDTTIVVLFVLQCAFIVVWGITGSVLLYIDEDEPVWYLDLRALAWYDPAVIPLRFLLLASMMIPISLKVSEHTHIQHAHTSTSPHDHMSTPSHQPAATQSVQSPRLRPLPRRTSSSSMSLLKCSSHPSLIAPVLLSEGDARPHQADVLAVDTVGSGHVGRKARSGSGGAQYGAGGGAGLRAVCDDGQDGHVDRECDDDERDGNAHATVQRRRGWRCSSRRCRSRW